MQKPSSSSVKVFFPKLDSEGVVAALKAKLGELRHRLPVKLVVLFGSYAKGNYTVASDIDVLVVYAGNARDDAFAVVKTTLGLRGLEAHVYSEDEYRSLQTTIGRMTEGAIPIFP